MAPPGQLRSHVVWAWAGMLAALFYLLLDVYDSGDGILRPIRAGTRGPGRH